MIRAAIFLIVACFWAFPSYAQGFGALARLLPHDTQLEASRSEVSLTLGLSQSVPFRVFTVNDPYRVVLDFREVDFDGLRNMVQPDGPVVAIEAGAAMEPGWSRLVMTLDAPFFPDDVVMETDPITYDGMLRLTLTPVSEEQFAERSGAPALLQQDRPAVTAAQPRTRSDSRLTLVLDPGHGGVDPGAVRGEVTEADIVLTFARELRDALRRTGLVDVVMTRDADVFVPLPTRVTMARAAQADGFVSIHADALADGRARGATVYTLAETATDAAAAALAEQHDRADILQGIDLHGSDDTVARVLMDLARVETMPRSAALADAMVYAMEAAELRLHGRPRGEAGFTVLRAAEIPSVLLEIGFMSDAQDLANIQDPAWRARMQSSLVAAVLAWAENEAARTALLRQ